MISDLSQEQILEMQMTLSPEAFQYYYKRSHDYADAETTLEKMFIVALDSGETYARPHNVYYKQKVEFITFNGQRHGLFFLGYGDLLGLYTFYAPTLEYRIKAEQLKGVKLIRIDDDKIEFLYD